MVTWAEGRGLWQQRSMEKLYPWVSHEDSHDLHEPKGEFNSSSEWKSC